MVGDANEWRRLSETADAVTAGAIGCNRCGIEPLRVVEVGYTLGVEGLRRVKVSVRRSAKVGGVRGRSAKVEGAIRSTKVAR